MSNKNHSEGDIYEEYSRLMNRIIAKNNEDNEDVREKRKPPGARLIAEERKISEERKEAAANLKEQRKEKKARFNEAKNNKKNKRSQ